MRVLFGSLIFCLLTAATWNIQTASCGSGTGCFSPVNLANFKAAVQAAACGDTIQTEAHKVAGSKISVVPSATSTVHFTKGCAVGQEIILRPSVDDSWLPEANAHIAPSNRENLWWLSIDGPLYGCGTYGNVAILKIDNLASGVKFVGMNLLQSSLMTIASAGCVYNDPIWIGELNPDLSVTTDKYPWNITFDHDLFYGTFEADKSYNVPIWANTKEGEPNGVTIQNSYVGGINGTTFNNIGGGFDTQFIRTGITGVVRMRNNVIGRGWTEPVFTGGNDKSGFTWTPGNAPQGQIPEYTDNLNINALQFMKGRPEFVGNTARPVIKNCFELKESGSIGSVIAWNSCHNVDTFDGSQANGVKLAAYHQGTYLPSTVTATLSTGANGPNSRVTITGAQDTPPYHSWARGGHVLGLPTIANPSVPGNFYTRDGDFEYHQIQTIVSLGPPMVFDMDAAYVHAFTTVNSRVFRVANPWVREDNVTVRNNLWRNVSTGIQWAQDSNDYYLTNGSGITNLVIQNNLQLIDDPYVVFNYALGAPLIPQTLLGGTYGANISHNGVVIKPSAATKNSYDEASWSSGSAPSSINRRWNGLKMNDNLFPNATYGMSFTGFPSTVWASLVALADSSLELRNNAFNSSFYNFNDTLYVTPCTLPQRCDGNVWGGTLTGTLDLATNHMVNVAANDFAIVNNHILISAAGPSTTANPSPIKITTSTPHNLALATGIRITGLVTNTLANGIAYVGSIIDANNITILNGNGKPIMAQGVDAAGAGSIDLALWHGATDNTDIGPDENAVPLIKYLTVTAQSTGALFTWQTNDHMKGRPCQLDVTLDRGVLDDSTDFLVIPQLRGDYFKGAESDRRGIQRGWSTIKANVPPAVGETRTFMVGGFGLVLGDDNQYHELNLNPGTMYYYRLYCSAAMEQGSFTTLSGIAR